MALLAGVSQPTVSRVINQRGRVSPETRHRVEAAMERLGYVPNAAARSLITRRTWMLGLVVSNITNGFYPEIVDAITSAALADGYSVIVGSAGERTSSQAAYLRLLAEQRVDGVILTSTLSGDAPELAALAVRGPPIVLANRSRDDLPLDSVSLDNRLAGRLATEHLISDRRRVIAFVGGREDAATNAGRFAGYLDAVAAQAHEPELVRHGEFTRTHGRAAVLDLLARSPTPDGIVAADDTIALGCLDALGEAGLAVPHDIGVVGFDDIPAASLWSIRLTTVSSAAQEMGARALALLLDRIRRGNEGAPRRVVLAPRLVVRNSCGLHGDQRSSAEPMADTMT